MPCTQCNTATFPPTRCHLQDGWVKLIANTRDVLPSTGRFGPHIWPFRNGATAVNTKGVPVSHETSSEIVFDEAYLHHYIIKSWEDFQAKMARGNGGWRGERAMSA